LTDESNQINHTIKNKLKQNDSLEIMSFNYSNLYFKTERNKITDNFPICLLKETKKEDAIQNLKYMHEYVDFFKKADTKLKKYDDDGGKYNSLFQFEDLMFNDFFVLKSRKIEKNNKMKIRINPIIHEFPYFFNELMKKFLTYKYGKLIPKLNLL
jgi:hypothetical protein